jgi:hypothetical protein
MKIYLEKSSGMYPSSSPTIIVDTANLKEEEKSQIQKLIEDSNFFNMTDSLPNVGAADFNTYTITVETEDRKHSVTTSSFSTDQNVASLIKAITKYSKNLSGN